MKLAVQLADPDIVRTVRSLADNPSDATHPVYDVSRSLGTGKATCRSCNQPIKENERTLLFRFAPHDQDHEHHYRRVRMVIHEDDCSQSGNEMVTCPLPSCKASIPQKLWSKHWSNHGVGSGWVMKTPAASVRVCAKHSLSHCGQCEEDRELEKPKLDKRVPTIETPTIDSKESSNFTIQACIPCWSEISNMAGSVITGLGTGTKTPTNIEHNPESPLHRLLTDVSNPIGYAVQQGKGAVQRSKDLVKQVIGSEDLEWRHTEEDGFEMWETKEDPNEFAIIENGDKYDLYYLKDSYSSAEEAKAAAESLQKTAQDGGGGGGAASSGGSGGASSSGGAASSAGSTSSGSDSSGMTSSGESTHSSMNESSESAIVNNNQDNPEAPQPPADEEKIKKCPECNNKTLRETQLMNGLTGFKCDGCGYTYRKRAPKNTLTASWINNLNNVDAVNNQQTQIEQLDISPQIPPSLIDDQMVRSEPKPAIDLFTKFKTSYRSVTCQRCGKTYRVNKKGHYTGFCETCKEKLGIVRHRWDSQDAQRGHYG